MAPGSLFVRLGLAVGVCLTAACLEPNPNAIDAGLDEDSGDVDETSDEGTTDSSESETGGSCDPCSLGFEIVDFDATGDGFSAEVPKPAFANTTPLALIRRYRPGNADALGYAIAWTETDSAWTIDVQMFDAAPNSRLEGLAVVIGSDEPATVELLEPTTTDCATAILDATDALILQSVEAYQPNAGEVLDFTGSGDGSGDLEWCITEATDAGASMRVRAIAVPFAAPVVAELADPVTVDNGAGGSASFDALPADSEVLQAIGLRRFEESASPDLGYAIACQATAPYTCQIDAESFSGGAEFEVAGAAIAIP